MHKYQLLRQRAEELRHVLEEYAKVDPDVEDFQRRFMPWYERVMRREIRLPCYEYQLSVYFTNPDLSPLAGKYGFEQPTHPLPVAETNFNVAIRDWLSGPFYLESLKASGEQPSVILDELPPPEEEAPLDVEETATPPSGIVHRLQKWWADKKA